MFPKTNLEFQLKKERGKRVSSEHILEEVQAIFNETDLHRQAIKDRISLPGNENDNSFLIANLNQDRIYHITEIQKICVNYRLRFLDSHRFKPEIPEEAISEIRHLENKHNTSLQGLKIMAPAKLLKLENADDPLLFAPMGNDYYYLIHKWGNDLHPFRKLLMWPYKNFENLIVLILLVSILLTAIAPMQVFTKGEVTIIEYFLLFLFMFKAVGGIVLFYGFAKGKNFNEAIWNSKYYNA